MRIPNKLRVVDGELMCIDGTDVREYLRKWAERNAITEDTPINVVDHDQYVTLRLSACIG